MKHSAQRFAWNELEADSPMPLLSRRRIIGKQAMLSHVFLKKGCFVPSHAHENEQFACVLSGRLRFVIGEENAPSPEVLTIGGGETLYLPSQVRHSAEALEDTVVLDVFSPPSEKTGIDLRSS